MPIHYHPPYSSGVTAGQRGQAPTWAGESKSFRSEEEPTHFEESEGVQGPEVGEEQWGSWQLPSMALRHTRWVKERCSGLSGEK